MAEILPPNWDYASGSFGRNMADIPEPHIRFFPSPDGRKRRVTISIMRYYGIGHHYYVWIEEEDNPVWDGLVDVYNQKGTWRQCWDDAKAKGRTMHAPDKFNDISACREWIRHALDEHFPKKEHRYVWEDYSTEYPQASRPKWFYRAGD